MANLKSSLSNKHPSSAKEFDLRSLLTEINSDPAVDSNRQGYAVAIRMSDVMGY